MGKMYTACNWRVRCRIIWLRRALIDMTEQRIPFEIVADPFYRRENIEELERRIADVESGKSILKEHELIEADE